MDPWAALNDDLNAPIDWATSETDSAYYDSDDQKGNPMS